MTQVFVVTHMSSSFEDTDRDDHAEVLGTALTLEGAKAVALAHAEENEKAALADTTFNYSWKRITRWSDQVEDMGGGSGIYGHCKWGEVDADGPYVMDDDEETAFYMITETTQVK